MPNPDGSPTVAEAIASLDAATGTSTNQPTVSPIGVPSYTRDASGAVVPFTARRSSTEDDLRTGNRGLRPTQQITTTVNVPPSYFDGDEFGPGSMSPSAIAALQQALIAAGLIDKKASIRIGVWDDTSVKGFTKLLGYANSTGMKWREALDAYGQGNQQGDESGRAPLQVKLSDPGELKEVFRKSVIDTLGQGWDDSKLDGLVSAYQQKEAEYQTQAYNTDETGGTLTQPPSAQAFAMEQAKAQDPGGAQAHDFVGQSNNFFSMLKGVV